MDGSRGRKNELNARKKEMPWISGYCIICILEIISICLEMAISYMNHLLF